MQNNDAHCDIKPGTVMQYSDPPIKFIKRYLLIFIILLSAVIILCINNISVYRSYNRLKFNFEAAFRQMADNGSAHSIKPDVNEKLEKANYEMNMKNNEIIAQNQEILTQLQVIKKINQELTQKNRELLDDNILLQNSLKKAASVGIKPQNYTSFDGISRGNINRGTFIGRFLGTAYTPSMEECGNNMGITNSGQPIVPGLTMAIDCDYWPFGTIFYIKGLGYAVAMDTGGGIKGKFRFDFAVFDKKFAQSLGQTYWDVYLVKLGNGKVEELNFQKAAFP